MPEKVPIRCRYLSKEAFMLSDGRCYRHLFTWSYVPELRDFEKLLAVCWDSMTQPELQIKIKLKKHPKETAHG